jgi:mono/diheme cytochrome c family protein
MEDVETPKLVKNFLLGFLTGLIIVILGAAGYLASGFPDIRSDATIPAWASRLMYSSVHAAVRRSAPKENNPLPPSDETLIAGGKLYLNDCVGCHGEPGKPPSEFGGTFYPSAPQFPSLGTAYEEGQVFWIAKHGIRRTGMSAQGFSYADKDLWAVAAFIRHLPNLPSQVLTKIQQQSSNSVAEPPK